MVGDVFLSLLSDFPTSQETIIYFFPPKRKTHNTFSLLYNNKIKIKQHFAESVANSSKGQLVSTQHQWSCDVPS